MSLANVESSKVAAEGKFFSRLGSKFFLKAMRLDGTDGILDFRQQLSLSRRLQELHRAHTTTLILTEAQAEPVLGIAAQAGLHALVEFRFSPDELLTGAGFRSIRSRVVHSVNILRSHPTVIGYVIDCPTDPGELRALGLDRLKRRMRKLLRLMRRSDNSGLLAVRHSIATIGLALPEEDFIYASMIESSPVGIHQQMIRLHNLAESRPLVVEFGEGFPGQDELVACAFGLGAAGVVAPAMRPAASPGLLGIRMLSAGELLPFVSLNGSCPPKLPQTPMVSVVICAYNAERTMRPCLESLRKLDYPKYEVIIVDDGSRDRTAEISMDFPEFRLIRQPNRGLGVARNVGMHAARGDFIAYTDSDCVVDPHWLTLMMRAMQEGGFDGCGGPNYAPHEDGWVTACVAASPGAPCHVLTGYDRAEHLAGCNMVFRKAALLQLDGFDPQFTAAGDDVDVCWRMLDAGFSLGFCPAAFVWHFRRNTVKAYYGQQRGYGKAEAMLYMKYPDRFNALGQIKWRGTIPGLARTVPGGSRNRVRWTRRASDFQEVHEAGLSIAKVLPLTAEWNLAATLALALSCAAGVSLVPALAALMLGPIWALYYAAKAPLEPCYKGIRCRLLIAFLAFTGPFTRTVARYRYRSATPTAEVLDPPRQRPEVSRLSRTLRMAYWNETWTTREQMLQRLRELFAKLGCASAIEPGWGDFDLVVAPDRWTKVQLKSADEEHEAARIKTHIAARVRLTALAQVGLSLGAVAAAASALLGFSTVAIALAVLTTGAAISAAGNVVRSGRLAYRVIEQSAVELNLAPLGAMIKDAAHAVSRNAGIRGAAPAPAEAIQPAGR